MKTIERFPKTIVQLQAITSLPAVGAEIALTLPKTIVRYGTLKLWRLTTVINGKVAPKIAPKVLHLLKK
jgi:hypothetical protein